MSDIYDKIITNKDDKVVFNTQVKYCDRDLTVSINPTSIEDLIPDNILKGKTVLGVAGNMIGYKEKNLNGATYNASKDTEQIVTSTSTDTNFNEAVINFTVKKIVATDIDSNIKPSNIKLDKTILGIKGTAGNIYKTFEFYNVACDGSKIAVDVPAGYDGIIGIKLPGMYTKYAYGDSQSRSILSKSYFKKNHDINITIDGDDLKGTSNGTTITESTQSDGLKILKRGTTTYYEYSQEGMRI